ncbi:serine threonine-protein kinase ulk4 [Willisornis vidua]|uniref:Serine threonine-protein kinase ulk4 n=1 Tax=Willisornis vidua TaxID=1566151 RepID=A0ABQ9D8G8_9PASS|nr:serine threonine-protein kinase ulk4 [Willisornis vidua]
MGGCRGHCRVRPSPTPLGSCEAITSNEKHLESLKTDGDALIQTLESLAQTASSHADVSVASLAFKILQMVGHENIKTTK